MPARTLSLAGLVLVAACSVPRGSDTAPRTRPDPLGRSSTRLARANADGTTSEIVIEHGTQRWTPGALEPDAEHRR